MFYELFCASNYPDKPDLKLDVEWNPIDVPKESEVAQMSSQTAQYVAHLINTGVIDIAEARAMLRKTNFPAFQTLPSEIPEILKKIEEAKDPTQQQGGMGMPGMGMPGMGGGMPGQEGGQPELPPDVKQNDDVFKQVMKEYLTETGQDNEQSQQQQGQGDAQMQPQQNPQKPTGQQQQGLVQQQNKVQ